MKNARERSGAERRLPNRPLMVVGGVAGCLLVAWLIWQAVDGRDEGESKPVAELQGELIAEPVSTNATSNLVAAKGSDAPGSGQIEGASTEADQATGAAELEAGDQENGDYKPVSFSFLSAFEYGTGDEDEVNHVKGEAPKTPWEIPDAVKAYDGAPVEVKGFVKPLAFQGKGLTEFLVTRDQLACCFGPEVKMNHWIHVRMPRGEFRPWIFKPVTVYGTLEVGEKYEGGSLASIFRLRADRVQEKL